MMLGANSNEATMTIICFELSMPNVGSWNGRWSGEGRCYARICKFGRSKTTKEQAAKILAGESFYYNFGDGWGASVRSVSFSPDGTLIVTSSDDNTAKVWDAKTGARLHELRGHADSVRTASFSPDGNRIVTASHDHTAKVWDVATETALFNLKGGTAGRETVSFTPDGERIVADGGEISAMVWNARTGEEL
jgi:WD40 repeat protein